jgi:hypothetical protein
MLMLNQSISLLESPLGGVDQKQEKIPDYKNWPETLIMVAGNDPPRDDGLYLACKLFCNRQVFLMYSVEQY